MIDGQDVITAVAKNILKDQMENIEANNLQV
jgi:hypothetical protein